jgi:hypothetical protein
MPDKVCLHCGVVKPVSEYYLVRGRTPQAACKPCMRKANRERETAIRRRMGIPERRRNNEMNHPAPPEVSVSSPVMMFLRLPRPRYDTDGDVGCYMAVLS